MTKRGKTIVTMDELFVDCVRDEMRAFVDSRNRAEKNAAEHGRYFKRGGYERVKWNADYIAEQYKLCLQKQCKLPSTERRVIVVLGDAATYRLSRIIEAYEKQQAEKKQNTEEQK